MTFSISEKNLFVSAIWDWGSFSAKWGRITPTISFSITPEKETNVKQAKQNTENFRRIKMCIINDRSRRRNNEIRTEAKLGFKSIDLPTNKIKALSYNDYLVLMIIVGLHPERT